MGRLGYTWDLMRSSWDVLKNNPKLAVFPAVSGLLCLIVAASFIVPAAMFVSESGLPDGEAAQDALIFAYMFAFYFCTYFVITFFNTALVGCAALSIEGDTPSLGIGFKIALGRLPQIAGWALLAATVGTILKIIESRFERIGRLVSGLFGVAFSLVSFLVVPVLVLEKKGPIAALKESAVLLKKTWGQQLAGNFGFGLLVFLLSLPGLAVIGFGVYLASMAAGTPVFGVVLIGLGVVYLLALGLIQATLQVIFQTALYRFARGGEAPWGFSEDLLQGAVHPR